MKKSSVSLLLHPIFLVSLTLLLLNDFYWKYTHHNWLTGKLSDVAGLVVLPVFLRAFFPKYKKGILLFTVLFFTWWKSSLSASSIIFLNQTLSLRVIRVVDYTDFLALPFLWIAGSIKPPAYSIKAPVQACLRLASAGAAFIALCATSVPYREGMRYGIRENEIGFYEQFNSSKTKEELLQHLRDKNMLVYEEKIRYYPVTTAGELYYRLSSSKDSTIFWTPVPQSGDSAIYLRKVSQPFYVIPLYVLAGDTLKNIEFTVQENKNRKKKSAIRIESFQTNRPDKYRDFYYGKQRKQFKKAFERLFQE